MKTRTATMIVMVLTFALCVRDPILQQPEVVYLFWLLAAEAFVLARLLTQARPGTLTLMVMVSFVGIIARLAWVLPQTGQADNGAFNALVPPLATITAGAIATILSRPSSWRTIRRVQDKPERIAQPATLLKGG